MKLAIEIDGPSHLWQSRYDRARMRYLRRVGIEVLRISNDEVLEKPTFAAELISAAIRERLPLTRRFAPPSPQGEG
jgi:very-short-patch-repair endonuclease